MDFFSRITPGYKHANVVQGAATHVQPAAPSGLSGLIGSLFGSATPAYKTADGQTVKAAVRSSGFWSIFAVTPSYKTVAATTVAEPEDDAGVLDDDEGACAPGPDEIVVL